MGYATVADLGAVPGIVVPAGAEQLLTRASRDVDQALIAAVYDPTDPAVIAALREATVEQAAGYIEAGDRRGTGATLPQSFSLGSLSVQLGQGAAGPARVGGLYRQAWLVLQRAGLTGQEPGVP